mmetsp:Transcript_49737/g.91812  ORF Transcript_49737/g.91812 Transcript_49737/m.91812 type:complete len:260 (-) Transcript_49737:10-789(-)
MHCDANCPHISFRCVVLIPYLWGPVQLCPHTSIESCARLDLTSETKVCQDHLTPRILDVWSIKKEVVWLDVPVHDVLSMNIDNGLQDLFANVNDLRTVEGFDFFTLLVNSLYQIASLIPIHNDADEACLFDHLPYLQHIRMLKCSLNGRLSADVLRSRLDPVYELHCQVNFLFVFVFAPTSIDNAERALAQQALQVVSIHELAATMLNRSRRHGIWHTHGSRRNGWIWHHAPHFLLVGLCAPASAFSVRQCKISAAPMQ